MSGTIRIERDGPIGLLIVDHPERRNALNAQMWQRIPELTAELDADPTVRVLIVRGAGDQAFVAGADISEFSTLRVGAEAERYDADNVRAFAALAGVGKPLIALIHGFCIGGGVAISVCADLRYAADDAVFAVPAARLGLGYPLAGAQALVGALGQAHAKELFFTGRRFRANEALRLGLVNEVLPKTELDAHVRALALGIADNAPLTLAAFKLAATTMNGPVASPDAAITQRAATAIASCFESADYREGVQAFLDKRAPRFVGR
jgi:enoyl-CoA hydratase/carnithine racemase